MSCNQNYYASAYSLPPLMNQSIESTKTLFSFICANILTRITNYLYFKLIKRLYILMKQAFYWDSFQSWTIKRHYLWQYYNQLTHLIRSNLKAKNSRKGSIRSLCIRIRFIIRISFCDKNLHIWWYILQCTY